MLSVVKESGLNNISFISIMDVGTELITRYMDPLGSLGLQARHSE